MNISNIETLLRRITLVSIFIVPFLAFLVPSSLFFPFITGKNFAFRILVDVMFASWACLAYYRAQYRPKFSWIMAALAAFVGIVFIADIFGANPYRSFWSNYERMEGFVGLLHLFGYFVVAGSVLSTEKLWTRFFHTIILTSVIMVFYGLIQLGGGAEINQGGVRLDGTLGNAAYLAVYMLFSIFFTALLFVRHKGASFVKWIYGIIMFFQGLILFYTATRGVMVGLAVGIVISSVLVLLLAKTNRRLRIAALGAIGVLVLSIASLAVFRDSSFVKESGVLNRIAMLPQEALSNPRFKVWGMAIDGFKERPLLGWGQDNFNVVFNKYYDPKMYSQEQWFDRAHNIFFDWLIAGGILGLLGYLSLFTAAIFLVWRNKAKNVVARSEAGVSWLARWKNTLKSYLSGENTEHVLEASLLSGLLTAYFINNIFVFDNLFSYILFFSLLAYLHYRHSDNGSVPAQVSTKARNAAAEKLPFGPVAITVSIALVAVVYFVNLKPLFANQALIEGISPHGNTFTKENIDAFKRALGYHSFGNGELREQILQSALRVKDASVDAALRQEMFDLAKSEMLLQVQAAPEDARYEMFTGMLFFQYGQNEEALAHYKRAHELSPNKQTIDFNLILSYINAQKIDEAYSLAKEAYELEPAFGEAAKFYAITAMYKGDDRFANELLGKTFGTELYYDDMLINVYAQLKKFDKIIAVLQKKLGEGGDDPQTRLRLAASYLEMGNKAASLAEIQKIIDAHPDFKAQGEYYMNEIRAGRKP